MIQIVVSVKDLAANAFGQPAFFGSTAVAERSFRALINDESQDTEFRKFPADFEMYQIGTFDSDSGTLVPVSPPVRIVRALDLVRVVE